MVNRNNKNCNIYNKRIECAIPKTIPNLKLKKNKKNYKISFHKQPNEWVRQLGKQNEKCKLICMCQQLGCKFTDKKHMM